MICSETILCLLHLRVPCIFPWCDPWPDCTILHPGRKCKPLVSLQLNQFLWWRLKSLNSFRVYSFRQIQRAIRHFIGWPRLNRFLVPIINCWSCGPYWRKIINLPSRQRTRSKPAFPRFLNLEPWSHPSQWSPTQSWMNHPSCTWSLFRILYRILLLSTRFYHKLKKTWNLHLLQIQPNQWVSIISTAEWCRRGSCSLSIDTNGQQFITMNNNGQQWITMDNNG